MTTSLHLIVLHERTTYRINHPINKFFKRQVKSLTCILIGATLLLAGPVLAQDATDDVAAIAKKAANPVASLAQVPFQFIYDARIGPDRNGKRLIINIQPIIPVPLNANWNMVSRTIVPVVWQNDITRGTGTDIKNGNGSQFVIGDIVQSLFFTPTRYGGIIWGVGPVLVLPTGTGLTGVFFRSHVHTFTLYQVYHGNY